MEPVENSQIYSQIQNFYSSSSEKLNKKFKNELNELHKTVFSIYEEIIRIKKPILASSSMLLDIRSRLYTIRKHFSKLPHVLNKINDLIIYINKNEPSFREMTLMMPKEFIRNIIKIVLDLDYDELDNYKVATLDEFKLADLISDGQANINNYLDDRKRDEFLPRDQQKFQIRVDRLNKMFGFHGYQDWPDEIFHECFNSVNFNFRFLKEQLRESDLNLVLPHLERLNRFNNLIDIQNFSSIITPLQQLTSLNLGKCYSLNDRTIQKISVLTNLKFLFLAHVPGITEESLKYIRPLTKLQILDLSRFTEEQQKRLNLPSLRGISDLVPLVNLRMLNLSNSPIQLSFRHLALLTNMQFLNFDSWHVPRSKILKEKNFKLLGQLTKLHFLNLNYYPLDNSEIKYLTSLTNLRSLAISGTLNDEGLKHLSPLCLQSLKLQSCSITDEGVKDFSISTSLKNLTNLDLSNCNAITHKAYEHLAQLVALEDLDLSCTQLTNQGFRHLMQLTALKVLKIVDCDGIEITNEIQECFGMVLQIYGM